MLNIAELTSYMNAPSIEALWELHCAAMQHYGFDRLIYGFTRYRTPRSLGNPDDFVLLTNQSSEYMQGFIEHGLYRSAPMMRWVLEQDGAFSWSMMHDAVARGELTESETKVLEFNRQHGVLAGYSISFKSLSHRLKGAVALTGRSGMSQDDVDAVWARHGEEIIFLNNLVHLRVLTLPHVQPGQELTSRQREVLGWVGDGKTTQDIALLMSLTPATVEKHLRLARQSLSVETTAQAVLKAAFMNQIFVLEA